MKIFLKFALQIPLLVFLTLGVENLFPDLNSVSSFGLVFMILLAYTTGDDLSRKP